MGDFGDHDEFAGFGAYSGLVTLVTLVIMATFSLSLSKKRLRKTILQIQTSQLVCVLYMSALPIYNLWIHISL